MFGLDGRIFSVAASVKLLRMKEIAMSNFGYIKSMSEFKMASRKGCFG